MFYIFPFLFAFSMYGWGQVFLFKKLSSYIIVNLVIGMSILLFIGGILNYLNLANQNLIEYLFYFGLVMFSVNFFIKKSFFEQFNLFKYLKKDSLFFLFPIIILLISIISSINPEAYNYRDDYQKYFVHPIKMLETGSVFGSTLNAIGPQTLGGQAFFQSFFINFLGLRSINIFDSVFCLSLSVILVLEFAIKNKILIFGVIISCLLILIHPQFVNISSLYSAVLFIITSIILIFEFFLKQNSDNFFHNKIILSLSLCFASLAVLKTGNIIFPFFYFMLFLILVLVFNKINRKLLSFIIITPFTSLLFISPWMIYPFKLLLNSSENTNIPLDVNMKFIQVQPYYKSLISNNPLFYGGTQLQYSLLSILGLLLIIFLVFLLKKKMIIYNQQNRVIFFAGSLSVLTGSLIYFVFIIFGAKYYEIVTIIRYVIPFITGTTIAGLLILCISLTKNLRYSKLFFIIAILAMSFNFLPQFIKRTIQSYECGSQLSFDYFACSERYIRYNKEVLMDDKKFLIQQLQSQIPENKKIMAWLNTSFYLNFKRNEIIDISIEGFDNPWTKFPSAEYMIWEYNGFATRSVKKLQKMSRTPYLIDKKHALRTLQHIKKINQLYSNGKLEVILNNGSIIIFKFI